MVTKAKTNTIQNIVMEVITVLITVKETIGEKEITSIIKITEMRMILELITMEEEIITSIPNMEESIKDLSINPMY
jgi:hypothetical protein